MASENMGLPWIVDFWASQYRTPTGQWLHPLDEPVFASAEHTFNLDHPVGPFVGDVLGASLIILNANGGYDPDLTPTEFPDQASIKNFLEANRRPSPDSWRTAAPYYRTRNYWQMIRSGAAVVVNACAYRSRKITKEPDNRRMLELLPSVRLIRRWLYEVILPMAMRGERLVIVNRGGLWKLPASVKSSPGVVVDRAPISPDLTGNAWSMAQKWLRDEL